MAARAQTLRSAAACDATRMIYRGITPSALATLKASSLQTHGDWRSAFSGLTLFRLSEGNPGQSPAVCGECEAAVVLSPMAGY